MTAHGLALAIARWVEATGKLPNPGPLTVTVRVDGLGLPTPGHVLKDAQEQRLIDLLHADIAALRQ